MISIEAILRDARLLPAVERLRLARTLFEEARVEMRQDEEETGKRGLASWSHSTQDEDWSEFYPAELRKRKAG